MYRWKYIQFHDKVAHLALKGVIPRSIPKYFSDTFPDALIFIEISAKPEQIKNASKYLLEWCRKENIMITNDFERKK